MKKTKKADGGNASAGAPSLDRLFNRVATQLESAGKRCRVQKGGASCAVFDLSATVVRNAPKLMRVFDDEYEEPGEGAGVVSEPDAKAGGDTEQPSDARKKAGGGAAAAPKPVQARTGEDAEEASESEEGADDDA